MQKEYVFIARGIGITPFRSMIQYFLDTNKAPQITLFYSATSDKEFLFKNILEKARDKFGLKIIYIVSKDGHELDEKRVKSYVADLAKPIYYISGPQEFVEAYRDQLTNLGAIQIKTDLFTGYV